MFSVTASDDPNHPFTASTATGCWSAILQKVRVERTRMGLGKTGTAVSGPEFFGFAMPEVAACIEGLPGGENCKSYICRCLRLDTNRKGKSKRLNRRNAPASMNFIEEEEELGERPSKRRAAERANQRWLQINDDESSASFSEEEDVESNIEVEEDHDSRTSRRKNKKRSAPSTQESEPEAKKNDLYSLPVESNEIKTEQLL